MNTPACEECRTQLALYADGELDTVQALAMDRHLAECRDCSARLDAQRALAGAIRRQAPYFRAPDDLRARIQSRLANAAGTSALPPPSRTSRRDWLRWTLPLAASLVIAIGSGSLLTLRGDHQRLTDELVSAHVRSLMVAHLMDVPSTDQHTVKPWFADKLDFSPPVRDLSSDGFTLIGGRLDYIAHHPAAALVYRHRLHIINLFIWPDDNLIDTVAARQSRSGYNLVHWGAGGMDYWAISDLNAEELQEFADRLKSPS